MVAIKLIKFNRTPVNHKDLTCLQPIRPLVINPTSTNENAEQFELNAVPTNQRPSRHEATGGLRGWGGRSRSTSTLDETAFLN